MLLVTLHFYFRQQESAETLRARTVEAEAREAEANARHLRELQASERRFHGAFTHASIGMALLGFDGRILQANAALAALLGTGAGDLAGQPLPSFAHADDAQTLQARLDQAAQGQFGAGAVELRFVRRTAAEAAFAAPPVAGRGPDDPLHTSWAALHFAAFTEPESGTPCLILQAQDVTGRRVAEDQLHHLAFHDTLTGLPNRRRFMQCLEGAVGRARSDAQYAYAVMFLDFDRFKLVNDSLGHGAGDGLLVQLARRLQERLRPSDIVARLGGDEFALLTERIGEERDALALAERLMEALRAPFVVAGQELQISASIGITFGRLGYTSAEAVLRDADTAMYKAKADGRARVAVFDGSLHAEVSRRLRLEGDLRRALDQGALSVAYQPVFELQPAASSSQPARGRLRVLEALVRWEHPTEGTLAPAAFLPIAQESGLMPRLSAFVLRAACRQVRAWQLSHAAWSDLCLSVNVAAEDLAEPGFAARVQAALLESGLRGEHLMLELTENILMARIDGVVPTLTELRRLGVRVAVDDFGTGYSSLSYLARLPIDMLKIDRSFVAHLTGDTDQAAVVRAIVHLGQSLRKAIVAEGIESSRQLEHLLALGCQLGQGHLLAGPLDVAATSELLARSRAGAEAGVMRLH
jgi:diguanylate cyclase (GGDEF)-like protein